MKLVSDHVEIPAGSPSQKWCQLMREGMAKLPGRTLDLDFDNVVEMMKDAGFVNVVHRPFKVPSGPWPEDVLLREAGLAQFIAMTDEGLSLALLRRLQSWNMEELAVLLAQVQNELYNKCNRFHWPWYDIPEHIEWPPLN
jgi:hypothetical protein